MSNPFPMLTLSLLAAVALVPAAANANGWTNPRPGAEIRVSNLPPRPPAPRVESEGRYELRTTDVWVPGYTERVEVGRTCKPHPRGKLRKCDGQIVTRQVPGYYERQEAWVWVPAQRPRVVVQAPAPVGWDIRVRL